MAWVAPAIMGGGAILGGLLSRSRGPAQTTNTVQANDPYAPTVPYLNEILSRIQQYGASPFPYGSPGEMVAPLTPEQQAGAGMVTQGAGGAQGVVGQAQQGIQPFLSGSLMNVESNPYLQAAIASAIRPVTQNFQESVLPGIQSGFSVGTDAYDQSREGIARGIATRGYLDTVGDISAQMANRGYETGMNATAGAFGAVPGLTTAATAPGQAQWNIGALLQAQEQAQRSAPGAFDQLQQQRLAFPAQWYTQIGQIGRQGTAVSTTPGVQGNPYLGALGGALTARSIYNMWPQQQQQAPAQTGGDAWDFGPWGG